MTIESNPLDPIIDWYRTVMDSMRVTSRVIDRKTPGAILEKHSSLYRFDDEVRIQKLDQAKGELKKLVVLSLAAVFERTLRNYLVRSARYKKPRKGTEAHLNAVVQKINRDIEKWNFKGDLLEVFPGVDPQCVGAVKQIVDYRNWVAHGHDSSKPPPSQTDPETAHKRLSEFLTQAGLLKP